MRYRRYWFMLLFLGLCSCLGTQNLKENEYMLYKQKVKGNDRIKEDDISSRFRQKENKKLFGMNPFAALYAFGQKFFKPEKVEAEIKEKNDYYEAQLTKYQGNEKKTNKLLKKRERKIAKLQNKLEKGNWIMRLGEPPAIYDSAKTTETAKDTRRYLHSKGNFRARVTTSTDTLSKKRINVTYHIKENAPYYINKVEYNTNNTHIDTLLAYNLQKKVNVGDIYDEDNIDTERNDIEKILRNNGYYFFERKYISLLVDSTVVDKPVDTLATPKELVDIKLIIDKTEDSLDHQVYAIDSVYFYTQARTNNRLRRGDLDTTYYKGIHYINVNNLKFSAKVLDMKILVKPKQLYSQQEVLDSQRLLNSLDMFKFSNIQFDTVPSQKLAMKVYTSPLEKRTITDEIGLNVIQGLPGPFLSITLKSRNVFGGYEIWENSARYSIDGQTSFSQQRKGYTNQELGFNSSLIFPKFIFPGSFKYRFNRYIPKTQLMAGYTSVRRIEYTRTTGRIAMIYTAQKPPYRSYNLALADINIVHAPRISPEFEQILDSLAIKGNNLKQSFKPGFISSINAYYLYNDTEVGKNKIARYFKVFVESGGTVLNLLSHDKILGLNYFKFLKFSSSYHFYYPLSKTSTLATRVYGGVAKPYGNNAFLPYDKFFFSGGGSSIRAWQPRRLGPGSYRPPVNPDGTFNYRIEQPGEIAFETNVEYRFKIVGFFNAALFVDAGNVWMLQKDESRPGAQISKNFLQDMAVGTGAGIRLDFTFLLLRLDVGVKMLDPAQQPGRKFVWRKGAKDLTAINIGIGYPF